MLRRYGLALLALLALPGCGGKAIVDGPAGTTDCNLDKPCDATHSLAHECDSNVTCITTEDPCGTEYVCIACPPASPAVSSACGPVDDYCSISWTGDPY